MDFKNDIFEAVSATLSEDPVHSNTHNHALVHNPFAWEEDETSTPDAE